MLQQRRQVVAWEDYVTAGLVSQFSGQNNTGAGHDPAAEVWADLRDDADLSILTPLRPGTRQWGPDYFESIRQNQAWFAWLSQPMPPSFSPEHSTMEVVFMPFAGADAGNGGDVIGCDDIPTAPFTTYSLQMAALNAEFLVCETSVLTVVNRRALTANTIYTASMPISPFNPTPALNGSKAIFYNGVQVYRAARTNNFFVQLPMHRINLSGNPVLIDVRQVFYGRIYTARLYDRALTAAEIAQNAALDRRLFGF